MSFEQPFNKVGQFSVDFDASDLEKNQYTAVKLGNAQNGATGTGVGRAALVRPEDGEPILGLLQENGAINTTIGVTVDGLSFGLISKDSAGGKVGDLLSAKADGTLDKAASGGFAVAQAVEDYVGGDKTTVLLRAFGKQ